MGGLSDSFSLEEELVVAEFLPPKALYRYARSMWQVADEIVLEGIILALSEKGTLTVIANVKK